MVRRGLRDGTWGMVLGFEGILARLMECVLPRKLSSGSLMLGFLGFLGLGPGDWGNFGSASGISVHTTG